MAGKRDVVYNFTSNTRGLSAGVNEAVKLLDRLSAKTNALQKTQQFGGPSLTRLRDTLVGMVQLTKDLRSQMSAIGPRKNAYHEAQLLNDQMTQLQDILNNFDTYAQQGASGINDMTQALMTANLAAIELMGNLRQAGATGYNIAAIRAQNRQTMNDATLRAATAGPAASAAARSYAQQRIAATTRTVPAGVNDVVVNYKPNLTGLKRSVADAQRLLKDIKPPEGAEDAFAALNNQVTTFSLKLKSAEPTALKDATTAINHAEAAMRILLSAEDQMRSKTQLNATQLTTLRQALTDSANAFRSSSHEVNKYIAMSREKEDADKEGVAAAYDAAKAANVQEAAVEDAADATEEHAEATRGATRSSGGWRNFIVGLDGALQGLRNRLRSSTKDTQSFGKVLEGVENIAQKLTTVLTTFAGVSAASFSAEVLEKAIDYVEIMELFRVATREAHDTAMDFVDVMEDIYGMDPNNIMQAVGMFHQLAGAIEMPMAAAEKVSLGLTKAAVDMSSLFNRELEDVVNDLTSGMMGMTRAVRKYGIDIRMTTLEATALSLGIDAQAESMTEADRQGLRYLTILKQTQSSMGNFAKTIESVANQFRIFKEQVSGVMRNIGNLFMPFLDTLVYKLNAVAMVLKVVIQYVAAFIVGFKPQVFGETADGADDVADSIGGIGSAAGSAAKKLKGLMAFDEINLLQESVKGGGGGGVSANDIMDPKIAAAIEAVQLKMEKFTMRARELRDRILAFLGFVGDYDFKFNFDTGEWKTNIKWTADIFRKNLIDKFPQWEKTINAVFDNAKEIAQEAVNLWNTAYDVVSRIVNPFKEVLKNKFTDENVSEFIKKLPDYLRSAQDILERWAPLFEAISKVFTEAVTTVFENIDWAVLVESLTKLAEALAPFVENFGAGLVRFLGDATEWASDHLIDFFDGLAESINKMTPEQMEGLGYGFGQLATALIALAPLVSILSGITKIVAPLAMFSGISGSLDAIAASAGAASGATAGATGAVAGLGATAGIVVGAVALLVAGIAGATAESEELQKGWSEAWENVEEIATNVWNKFLKPTFDAISKTATKLWDDHLGPMFTKLTEVLQKLWNDILAPIADFLIDVLGPVFTIVFDEIGKVVGEVVGVISDTLGGLFTSLGGVIDFIAGVFTGDWDRAWQGIKDIFSGIWDALVGLIKWPINLIIGIVEGLANAVVWAWNGIKRAINSISFTVPDWVPGVGGEHVGFNLAMTPEVHIARIAENGGYIQTGQAFIAREAGPELVGTIGGRTAVANNDQIVRGIASGVATANQEQNDLLREQNKLLRGILEKETGIVLSPSRELGRIAQRSLNMYAPVRG